MVDLGHLHRNFYIYSPSVGGAVFFLFVFLAAAAAHLFYAWRYHYKRFIPVIIGGFLEFIAFCVRAGAHNYLTSLGAYCIQNLFILLAPVLFAATIYTILSKIIRTLNAERHSPMTPKKITWLFVSGDILCLVIQGNGGSLQAINIPDIPISLPTLGKWVTVGGLVLQICIFGCFVWIAQKVHRRIKRQPTAQSLDPDVKWEICMMVLYVAGGLIVVRNFVRIVEYCQGFNGWIISHEAMLFVFDALPMSVLMILLLVFHPARLLGPGSVKMSHVHSASPWLGLKRVFTNSQLEH